MNDNISFSDQVILKIKTPRVVENSLVLMSALLADLHKLISAKGGLTTSEKTISLELILQENYFHYQIVTSPKLAPIIVPLLYTKFPNIEVSQENLQSETAKLQSRYIQLSLSRSKYFPLKTSFESQNDPYMVMAAILSKMQHQDEKIGLQLLIQPTGESWLKQFVREKFYFIVGALNNIKLFFEKPFLEKDFINYYEEVKKKYGPKLFLANLRVMTYGGSEAALAENLALMDKALDKLSNGDVNSFRINNLDSDYVGGLFDQRQLAYNPMVLNADEAAAIFHFPDNELKITNVDHVSAKRIEPPKHLPKSPFLSQPIISTFGRTNFRNSELDFGIARPDRNRHMYIVGKTGMGKSKLIELLALSDIYHGKSLCLIDPHGDLATDVLKRIPQERVADVIYFNPADKEYPVGFNPLACHTPESKHQVVTGFIAIFKKQFGHNWTNRLEHMLRFVVLALIEAGNATVIDIVRLLTEVEFRQAVIGKIEDPVVKNFWTHEFAAWNEKFDNEAIIPIINHVGQFIANDYIRNVVGQKQSAFDFYQAMQEKKIIIVNIAKGKLGEENTALLGSMLITKIQEATMARVNISEEERSEFYLYVDEFQHFATESFNQILSEARKFNVSLVLAHQFLGQLKESIRKTVFGNVGSFVSFRVGPEDARFLAKEFTPHVDQDDLINLDFRDMYVKLSVGGKTTEPFSAITLDVPQSSKDNSRLIIESSRKLYAAEKKEVLKEFQKQSESIGLITSIDNSNPEFEPFEEPLI